MERTTQRELSLTVEFQEDDGCRADVVLGRRLPGLSRRVARDLGLAGLLRREGLRIAPSTRVRIGDRLSLWLGAASASSPAVDCLHETGDFVFVAKPRDLHTHRLRPTDPPALADAVAQRFPECASASPDPREGGALHRLDGATTGVVAFARHRAAWERGRQAIAHTATKLYLALVDGTRWPDAVVPHHEPPPSIDLLRAWIANRELPGFDIEAAVEGRGTRVRVGAPGAAARTRVWSFPTGRAPHCVVVQLVGGRRHQVRAHLAHVGWPLVGDAIYGSSATEHRSDSVLMLHAIRLELGAGLGPGVEAPLPSPWSDVLVASPSG